MNNFFSEFPKSSKTDWEDKLRKELKGVLLSEAFLKTDEIEGINFSSYTHVSDMDSESQGRISSNTSSNTKKDNSWLNAVKIDVENTKEANEKALKVLMTGADALVFDLKSNLVNLEELLEGVGLEFISIHFVVSNIDQFKLLNEKFKETDYSIFYRVDNDKVAINDLIKVKSIGQKPFCFVNAFKVQQVGASIRQELAYALSLGNEYLSTLMSNGITIEEAADLIHFDFGIGSNYFNEIAKIRAFKKMWLFILEKYNHQSLDVLELNISATVGFVNKSLKDPYTNLLRQSTEAMSAIVSGIDMLTILPYDAISSKGESDFSLRMAQNIPLILKEESYFDKVIDPFSGSYSIEKLTEEIQKISWELFQKLESLEGINNESCQSFYTSEVKKVVELKKEAYLNGRTLIGVNKFKSLKEESNNWKLENLIFGMKQFVIEKEILDEN
ncbi:methylmalonyl-CoA mutase family protein [Crocinitomicaceae bacterium]|nr:methylmalonyl-CoA mutase family protein [Crocinitomicaceae bacterium]